MKIYTKKEIKDMLYVECCHVTGMHDPKHFKNKAYVCFLQKARAFERLLKYFGIKMLKVKSSKECGWCEGKELEYKKLIKE